MTTKKSGVVGGVPRRRRMGMGMGMGITGEGMEKGSPRSAVQCGMLLARLCVLIPSGYFFFHRVCICLCEGS